MELACKIGLRLFLIVLLFRCYPETPYVIDNPSPEHTPREVVIAQLKALKNNDVPYLNAGIEVVYRFASPYQRAENGPLSNFRSKFNNLAFRPLINCDSYYVEKHFANSKKAEYFVFVTDENGEEQIFLFRLSKQNNTPYENIWMTDEVIAHADARVLTGHYYVV